MPFKLMAAAIMICAAFAPAHANTTMDELVEAATQGGYENITSILVAKDGKVLAEHYFGGRDADTLHNTRSVTKSLTSMAVGAAIYQGALLDEHERVFQFFGDVGPHDNMSDLKRVITVRDLMTMSSALACNDNDPASPGYEDKMHERANWTEFVLNLPTMEGYARNEGGFGPFRYCTAGSFLIGQLLERAMGLSVDEFADDALFGPLGITRYEWYRSPSAEEQTGGGLLLSTRSLWKVAELVRAGGMWHGRRLLPKGWTSAMTSPQVSVDETTSYGYLWWVGEFKSATTSAAYPAYYMAGNGGNKVVVIPSLKMVTVITSTNYNTRGMHAQTTEMLERYILPAFERGAVHQGR
ncbi:serine hydrolase domain-containing protein [Kordiimonas sp.]|uniref:serine hydrolase domain-containing protein n=1 Tax=Kordiimonas sp. TaxID=1970157 RepID=UPI003A93D0AC